MAPAAHPKHKSQSPRMTEAGLAKVARSTKHRYFVRADAPGPSAENIPHAPPPWTPTMQLHASTATDDSYTGPTSTPAPSSAPAPVLASTHAHGVNVGALVGAVLAGTALLAVLLAGARVYATRRARRSKTRKVVPMRITKTRSVTIAPMPKDRETASLSSSFGNFVLISNSEDEVSVTRLDFAGPGKEQDVDVKEALSSPSVEGLPDVRRYSSPSAQEMTMALDHLATGMGRLTHSASAPASPSLHGRDASIHAQRQKLAELAQLARMKFVREELPITNASCPELSRHTPTKRRSIAHGLGIVHASESTDSSDEVDIAGTLLGALERYSVSFEPAAPGVPVSKLFQVDSNGRVVRLSSSSLTSPASAISAVSPISPASDAPPQTPQSPMLPDTGVLAAPPEDAEDDSVDDVDGAVIVRLGQARSMEIKRGVLVSLHTAASLATAPAASHSAPFLHNTDASRTHDRPKSTGRLPAAPVLSPIVTSSTSLSADIEESLEEHVFAYRPSGPWSKENYKLTTPGQVRALTEALALAKPQPVQRQAWPWPAHRSAVLDELDEE